MKIKSKLLSSLTVAILISSLVYAQVPQGMNYQSVLRNADGSIMSEEFVEMEFSIRTNDATGPVVYQETKSLSTNTYGLVNHVIGTGTVVSGDFATIDWVNNNTFLEVKVNTGSGFVELGTTQFMSVPYALAAGSIAGGGGLWQENGTSIYNSNTGSVGIGTSNPQELLTLRRPGNDNYIRVDAGGTGSNYGGIKLMENGLSYGMLMRMDAGSDKLFFSHQPNANTINDYLTLTNGGTFGIGTTSPDGAYTMHTEGGALITGGYTRLCNSFDNSEGNVGMGGGPYSDVKLTVRSDQWGGLYVDAPNTSYGLVVVGAAAKSGGGSWSTWSDRRLKQNVRAYGDGLETLMAINPVVYNYNALSGQPSDKDYVGVIAQELQDIAPYMVDTATMPESDQEYLNVDNSAMTYMLINAIKEQQAQIEALKTEIENLK